MPEDPSLAQYDEMPLDDPPLAVGDDRDNDPDEPEPQDDEEKEDE